MTRTLPLLLLCLLPACGPSAGLSQKTPVTQTPTYYPPVQRTFAAEDAARQALLREVVSERPTSSFDLPFSGQLNYRGHLNTTLGAGRPGVVGDLEMQVDLTRDRVSGVADRFIDSRNRTYDGELRLINGTFDRRAPATGFQAGAGVTGILRAPDASTHSVSGFLSGDTVGRDAGAFVGVLSGEVKSGFDRSDIKGGVVARRTP